MLTDYELAVLTMPATKGEINAHAAKLDGQLRRAIETIAQRLVQEGWGRIRVEYHEELLLYTFVVTRHTQDSVDPWEHKTWGWRRAFKRSFLRHCDAGAVADVVAERIKRAWTEAMKENHEHS